MNEILLEGCRAEPLASYLKALGAFRLLAMQRDPQSRAWWQGDCLALRTSCSAEDLVDFLVRQYRPTPLVSPWLGGSGFYPGDARVGLDAILGCKDARLDAYRTAIRTVEGWPEFEGGPLKVREALEGLRTIQAGLKAGKEQMKVSGLLADLKRTYASVRRDPSAGVGQDSTVDSIAPVARARKGAVGKFLRVFKKARTRIQKDKRGAGKETLMARARSELPEEVLPWLDAAFVLRPDAGPACTPMLGSGGNEGRLDHSSNFAQHVSHLLLGARQAEAASLARSALFGEVVPGLKVVKIGQLDPGRAGGFNQGREVETKEFTVNWWDYVLALEGVLMMASAACRRSTAEAAGFAAIPFTVASRAVGFTSACARDDTRAETWLPLWSRPTGIVELKHLLSEGRSTVGRRPSRDGLDFSRAVATLGVDRGLSGFVRFAFLKRRGDSYIALPAGRADVRNEESLSLLCELDPLLDSVDRFVRMFKKGAPARLAAARSQVDQAMFDLCQQPDPLRFQAVLRALGGLECLLAQRDRTAEARLMSPLSGLSPRWVLRAGDSAEIRLAAALASIGRCGQVGPIRCNMAPIDPVRPYRWASGNGQRAWFGNSVQEKLVGVLDRRLMDANRLGSSDLPLRAAAPVHAGDALPFLYGDTDDALLEKLLWAFTLVRWDDEGSRDELRRTWQTPRVALPLPRDWCLLKLLFMPGKVRGLSLRSEPRILGLLTAGRIVEACTVAVARLRSSGLIPRATDFGDGLNVPCDRLAAALLFPVWNKQDLERTVLASSNPISQQGS